VGNTAAGRCLPLLFRCFGRCYPADISLFLCRRKSPKSEQPQGLRSRHEVKSGAGNSDGQESGRLQISSKYRRNATQAASF
jgi:hypothetical protein